MKRHTTVVVMQSGVARMMGRPIIPGSHSVEPTEPPGCAPDLVRPSVHVGRKQTSAKQEMFRKWVVSGHPSRDTSGAMAIDAHCHLTLLQFNFGTNPVVTREGAFQKWKGGSDVE